MTWGRIVVHWTFSVLVLDPSDTLLYILNWAMGGPGSFSTVILVISKHIFYLVIIIKSEVPIISRCLGLGHETMECTVIITMFLSRIYLENFMYKWPHVNAESPHCWSFNIAILTTFYEAIISWMSPSHNELSWTRILYSWKWGNLL